MTIHDTSHRLRIAVIGGSIGGLFAAALLTRAGNDVTVSIAELGVITR